MPQQTLSTGQSQLSLLTNKKIICLKTFFSQQTLVTIQSQPSLQRQIRRSTSLVWPKADINSFHIQSMKDGLKCKELVSNEQDQR